MEMYDRLLAVVEESDCRAVLENLQAASRDRHLPAFRRCIERQGKTPPSFGCGKTYGRGHRHRAHHGGGEA